MRDIFRKAFEAADLPYFNPHSFRKTLMAHLGHTKLDTSVNNYGPVSLDRQRMRMLALHNKPAQPDNERAALIADVLAVLDARASGEDSLGN